MNLLNKAIKKLASVQRVKEIMLPEFANASGLTIDPDENLYRRITQVKRDFDQITHERAIVISYYLYEVNGFFKRLIDIPMEAIEQAGFDIQTEDEMIQERWDEFWNDPMSGWKHNFFNEYKEIKLSGEGIWPVATNPINGDLETYYIDPMNVKRIKMVPGNVKIADKVIEKNKTDQEGKAWDIIRLFGSELRGETFYFGFNKPINASRGRPELMHILDHIDVYDQMVFSEAERGMLKKSFVWDVTLTEAKEGDLQEWYKKNFMRGDAPKPGSVRVHNEKEEWKDVTPALDASDATDLVSLLRQNVAGAAGYPEFYFGWGGDTNVATAREMQKPTVWMIQREQRRIVRIISTVFAYQLQQHNGQKQTMDGLFRDTGEKWEIKPNNVFPKDYVVQSAAFRDNVSTIAVAKSQRLIGEDAARKMFVSAANEIGYDVNINELEEEFEEEGIAEPVEDEINLETNKPMPITQLLQQSRYTKNGKKKKKVSANRSSNKSL